MFFTASILLSLQLAVASASTITLATHAAAGPGAYEVCVDGKVWFTSGATFFTKDGSVLSTADGSLKSHSASVYSGSDSLGKFNAFAWEWDEGNYVTTAKEYKDALVFEQTFPQGVNGTTATPNDPMKSRDDVSSSFPALIPANVSLGFLAFAGDMMGGEAQRYGKILGALPTGVSGFGPAAIFTEDLASTVVVSSFSNFMAASAAKADDGGVAYGVQGSFTSLPPGYSVSYIVALAPNGGVNGAFEAWGDKLLGTYGKSREVSWTDYSLRYLGYSTDNGAFYYYQTEGGEAGKRFPPTTGHGKTYEDTLIDVKRYADEEGIPYKYVLLDSWWYYQGEGGGVSDWVGRPDVFPHGNSYLRNKTGWPIMGHNRYWAADNVYATANGGQYDFVVERKKDDDRFSDKAWPTEQRFWDDLLYNASLWGLFMYEQDWLDTEYDRVVHLNTDAEAGRTWLLQMGAAAARNDLTIQYCMSHCRHIMQSVEIPSVTNARASGDYHPGNDQWSPLGTSSIFGWSIGVAPTKDNFWSTDVQAGSSYSDYGTIIERYNRLEGAVSTLSKGPVAVSDKIGRSDVALILKSCTKDGRLLQGDKPAMTLDSMHRAKAFKNATGELWATHTELDGNTFAVVLGATLPADTTVSLADVGLHAGNTTNGMARVYLGWEANSTGTVVAIPQLGFKACDRWDFQLWAVAPVLSNGWTLLGEPTKWVPVSRARFSRLAQEGPAGKGAVTSVVASGIAGETVEVAWARPGQSSGAPLVVSCVIPDSGTIQVTVGPFGSKCVPV